MPKLEEVAVRPLKEMIRSLSREAAIQVLLGVVKVMENAVSLRSVDFPEFIKEGVMLTEAKNAKG